MTTANQFRVPNPAAASLRPLETEILKLETLPRPPGTHWDTLNFFNFPLQPRKIPLVKS